MGAIAGREAFPMTTGDITTSRIVDPLAVRRSPSHHLRPRPRTACKKSLQEVTFPRNITPCFYC